MAAQFWRILPLLPRNHRTVLHALRSAAALHSDRLAPPRPHPDAAAPALLALVAQCGALAIRLGPPGSPYVSLAERLLLAGLAMQQRGSVAGEFATPDLGEALKQCALALATAGQRLSLNTAMMALLADNAWIATIRDGSMAKAAVVKRAPVLPVRRDTAKWSVIEHISRRATASSAELQALGITRQYISLLLREGVLERAAFGYYRLGRHLSGAGAGTDEAGSSRPIPA